MYRQAYGRAASGDALSMCKRDIFHAVWKMVLDEEFLDAYKRGMVIECADGIKHRLFPRIFTYGADYLDR